MNNFKTDPPVDLKKSGPQAESAGSCVRHRSPKVPRTPYRHSSHVGWRSLGETNQHNNIAPPKKNNIETCSLTIWVKFYFSILWGLLYGISWVISFLGQKMVKNFEGKVGCFEEKGPPVPHHCDGQKQNGNEKWLALLCSCSPCKSVWNSFGRDIHLLYVLYIYI